MLEHLTLPLYEKRLEEVWPNVLIGMSSWEEGSYKFFNVDTDVIIGWWCKHLGTFWYYNQLGERITGFAYT